MNEVRTEVFYDVLAERGVDTEIISSAIEKTLSITLARMSSRSAGDDSG